VPSDRCSSCRRPGLPSQSTRMATAYAIRRTSTTRPSRLRCTSVPVLLTWRLRRGSGPRSCATTIRTTTCASSWRSCAHTSPVTSRPAFSNHWAAPRRPLRILSGLTAATGTRPRSSCRPRVRASHRQLTMPRPVRRRRRPRLRPSPLRLRRQRPRSRSFSSPLSPPCSVDSTSRLPPSLTSLLSWTACPESSQDVVGLAEPDSLSARLRMVRNPVLRPLLRGRCPDHRDCGSIEAEALPGVTPENRAPCPTSEASTTSAAHRGARIRSLSFARPLDRSAGRGRNLGDARDCLIPEGCVSSEVDHVPRDPLDGLFHGLG